MSGRARAFKASSVVQWRGQSRAAEVSCCWSTAEPRAQGQAVGSLQPGIMDRTVRPRGRAHSASDETADGQADLWAKGMHACMHAWTDHRQNQGVHEPIAIPRHVTCVACKGPGCCYIINATAQRTGVETGMGPGMGHQTPDPAHNTLIDQQHIQSYSGD